ncbi:MAG TPA: DUF3857 domain-containing protein [Bacteroidia bacterium]|nr:DUF3857 domain-containing protein [Bacteroidia bacterium]
MKNLLIFLLLVQPALDAAAKPVKPEWKKYSWEETRAPFSLSPEEKKKSAVVITDKRIIETFFDETEYNSEICTYYTRHVIVRLNSDNAIGEFNKVYIPMINVTGLVDLHARFISGSGKLIKMDTTAVKDVENYNGYGPYKIFALEGVEIGGEVEYIYTVKKPFRLYGTETYQSSYDYRTISLDIVAPEHLQYDAKGYNGLISPSENDDYLKKNVLSMNIDSIAGFEDEMYSAETAAYPRVEYKLAFNLAQNRTRRIYTWNDAADAYYKTVNDATSMEKKLAVALYRKMNPGTFASEEEKVRRIESYLKTNYSISENASSERFDRIGGILTSKVASSIGIIRLFYAVFDAAGIRQEIVLTTDRFEKQFDGDFDSWTYLQNFLIYLTDSKLFIAPTEQFCRGKFIQPGWAGQEGLFIRAVTLGGEVSAVGTVKPIHVSAWEENLSNLYASICFDLSNNLANLHMRHSYSGYSAQFIQPYYSYMSPDDRREALHSILKNTAEDAKPKNMLVSGYSSDDSLYRYPFAVEADYTTNIYLEQACGKYIFKVGEVIGMQVQMYQAHERRTDMILSFPHGFKREIRFTIPDGYHVTNLESLNIDVFHQEDSVRTMEFISSYSRNGNEVTVVVEENYRQAFYPRPVYDAFRNVINASADFNKLVVFFEKD